MTPPSPPPPPRGPISLGPSEPEKRVLRVHDVFENYLRNHPRLARELAYRLETVVEQFVEEQRNRPPTQKGTTMPTTPQKPAAQRPTAEILRECAERQAATEKLLRNMRAAPPLTAWEEIEKHAAALRQSNPALGASESIRQATEDHPDLYDRYLVEQAEQEARYDQERNG